METLTAFREMGYITQDKILNNQELQELEVNLEELIANDFPGIPQEQIYFEVPGDKSTLKQIQQLSLYSEYFSRLGSHPSIVALAEECLEGPVELKNMQYFNKVPGNNKGTPAHQDGYYFMITPQEAVTMWLSLDHADADNGAVLYIPGSHLDGMRPHQRTKTLGFSQEIADWSEGDTKAEIQMTAVPGDILVHHSLTIHRAGENKTTRNRRSIGFIFYRADVKIDEAAHAAYQKRLDEDLKSQGRI